MRSNLCRRAGLEIRGDHSAPRIAYLEGTLEIYRRLGVREVWRWRGGQISVHRLRGQRYTAVSQSLALPGIDLEVLVSFVDRPTTSQAVREYRVALNTEPARAAAGKRAGLRAQARPAANRATSQRDRPPRRPRPPSARLRASGL